MRADELMSMSRRELEHEELLTLQQATAQGLWLIDNDACDAACLLARFPYTDDECHCRCGGEFHGSIRQACALDEFVRPILPVPRGPSKCRCGAQFQPTHFNNSGTTEISLACPRWIADQDKPNWYHDVPGHQYVMTTKEKHRALGCCSVREVRG